MYRIYGCGDRGAMGLNCPAQNLDDFFKLKFTKF